MLATRLGFANIGNAAHAGGLVFGVAAGFAATRAPSAIVARSALAALLVGSLVPLFWCPWSFEWCAEKAYAAHVRKDYRSAVTWYRKSQRFHRQPEWVLRNLALAYRGLETRRPRRRRPRNCVAWIPRPCPTTATTGRSREARAGGRGVRGRRRTPGGGGRRTRPSRRRRSVRRRASRSALPGSPSHSPPETSPGNGKTDILVASEGTNDVVVLIGDGEGGLRPASLRARERAADRNVRR